MARGYAWPLRTPLSRERACRAIWAAPEGSVARIEPESRTLAQNAKMHAMLSDVAMAKPMGRRHTCDDWKAIFMNACGWECQFIEGLDGRPFPQGFRSSRLSKEQMSNLIEFMLAFGSEHNIKWSDGHG